MRTRLTWSKEAVFTISRSGGESLRTKQWRYTQWKFGESGVELYDLEKDPGEFTNQASNPEYSSVVESMKKQLHAKRDEAGYRTFKTKKKSKAARKKKSQ